MTSMEWKNLKKLFVVDHGTTTIEEDKREAARLVMEMHTTINEVRESDLYANIVHQLKNEPKVQSNISNCLGPNDSRMLIVIYGLGSIEYEFESQYQLALVILLKRDFNNWFSAIEVYDPEFTRADSMAIEALGCTLIKVNEYCQRRVEEPTLFFTAGLLVDLYANLFEANWSPSQLNRMVLLTTSLSYIVDYNKKYCGFVNDSVKYMKAIAEYIEEVQLETKRPDSTQPLSHLNLHFFRVGLDVDMNALLQRVGLRERRKDGVRGAAYEEFSAKDHCRLRNYIDKSTTEPFQEKIDRSDTWHAIYSYRRPLSRFRCFWNPPPRGWMKLNFSRSRHSSTGSTGYGGIVHNEYGETLIAYAGPMDDGDPILLEIEALKQGLRCFRHLSSNGKFMIEGDALSVVRWANDTVELPDRYAKPFEEIPDLFDDFECLTLHVYEDANTKACTLANRGAELPYLCIWDNKCDSPWYSYFNLEVVVDRKPSFPWWKPAWRRFLNFWGIPFCLF